MSKKIFLMFVLSFLVMPSVCLAEELESKLNGYCKEISGQDGKPNFKFSESVLFDGSKYDANCIYVIEDTIHCDVFQISFNKDGSHQKKHYSSSESVITKYFDVNPSRKELTNDFIKTFDGSCMNVVRTKDETGSQYSSTKYYFEVGNVEDRINRMERIYERNANISSAIIEEKNEGKTCIDLLGDKGSKFLKKIVDIFFLIVPFLLVVFSSVDFAKVVFAGGEDDMKKVQARFIKRLLIGAAVFLIPIVLSFILDIGHSVWPVWPSSEDAFCGIFD